MSSLTANSLRRGKKVREEQGFDQPLSKVLELNCNYRIFFKKLPVDPSDPDFVDLAVAMVPGRSCDLKVCGTTFIPFTKDMYTVAETGDIIDQSGLDSWARISRVLHDARCTSEKKSKEAESERAAKEVGKPIDQVALSKALEAIEEEYHGGTSASGQKIMPTKTQAISGIQNKMSTRIVVVKMLPTGAPDWKNAKYAILEISNARMNELISLCDDPNFNNKGRDYIEVQYNYTGADKKTAGQAAKFQGIAQALSLESTFPAEWESMGKDKVLNLASGTTPDELAEYMRSRNRNLSGGKAPSEIVTSFKKWCGENAVVFGSIDFEADQTRYTATAFLESHLLDSIPLVKEKFEALADESGKPSEDTAAANAADAMLNAAQAPVAEDPATPAVEENKALADAVSLLENAGGQSLKEIAASGVDVADALDEDLGSI